MMAPLYSVVTVSPDSVTVRQLNGIHRSIHLFICFSLCGMSGCLKKYHFIPTGCFFFHFGADPFLPHTDTTPHKCSAQLLLWTFLSIPAVLRNLVCFRWRTGDDSCSSSKCQSKGVFKEMSSAWCWGDNGGKKGRSCLLTCVCLCLFLCREEGIRTREMQLKCAWYVGGVTVWILLHLLSFSFLLFLSLHSTKGVRSESFIVDHKSALSWETKDWNW